MEKQEIEHPQSNSSSYAVHPSWGSVEDEVSLLDLWRVLLKQRILIAMVTSVTVLVAVLYAFSIKPVYEAEAYFLPPPAKEVPYEMQGVQNKDLIIKSIYGAFKRNLGSMKLQRLYFDQAGISQLVSSAEKNSGSDEVLFESFQDGFKIKDGASKDSLLLAFEWEDAEGAARIVNEFSKLANQVTLKDYVMDWENTRQNKIREIEYEIASKRKMAEQRRKDRLARLSESILIAKKMVQADIPEAENYTFFKDNESSSVLNRALGYRKGVAVLQAEIDVLTGRKSDAPFIEGLRDLQEELALLLSIKISETQFNSATFDRMAYTPEQRVRPDRRNIAIVGLLLGLMLGILLGFIRNAIGNQRERSN